MSKVDSSAKPLDEMTINEIQAMRAEQLMSDPAFAVQYAVTTDVAFGNREATQLLGLIKDLYLKWSKGKMNEQYWKDLADGKVDEHYWSK